MHRRTSRSFRARCEPLEPRSLLSVVTPTQMRHAYGVDGIVFSASGQPVAATGAGQTIAIVVAYHNQHLASEVATFDATYNLGNFAVAQVNLAGPVSNQGWAQEEAMDVEWAHAFAPGASIVVVEAASDNTSDLMAAVDVARHIPGVTVVSMSWGGSEFRGETAYDPHLYDSAQPHRGDVRGGQRRFREVRGTMASNFAERRGRRRDHAPGDAPGTTWANPRGPTAAAGSARSSANRPIKRESSEAAAGRSPTSRWLATPIPALGFTSFPRRPVRAHGRSSAAPASRFNFLAGSLPS